MAFVAAIFLFLVLTILYVLFIKRCHQYWTKRGVPQFQPGLIWGDAKDLLLGTISVQEYYYDLYQKIKAAGYKHAGIYKLGIPEYIPIDPDLVKQMLIKDFNYFGSHGNYYANDDLSHNLFGIEGEEWKERRTKLTPIFTAGKMKAMFEMVEGIAAGLERIIQKHLDEDEAINIKEICARFTTDTVATTAFGLDIDTLTHGDHEFREVGKQAFKPSILRFAIETLVPFNILRKIGYVPFNSSVTNYFTTVVKNTINYRETHDVNRKDFMQLMLQLKNRGTLDGDRLMSNGKSLITEQEIINESFLFYLAGFETSSSTMNFVLFELSRNADTQEKLRNEILQVLKGNDGKLSYDLLMEMDYLDRVIKETLRLHPVISVLPRECTRDYTVPGTSSVIKKGTKVIIPVTGIQRDPEFYPHPDVFNPDNFLPENKANRPDCTWIPFGEGPRQCIGLRFGIMQMKIGICQLLKDYRFVLDKTMKPPYKPDKGTLVYMFEKDVMLRATRI